MCSNCSGDDLKPESFAIFDVSSPKAARRFAENAGAKRKSYGTSPILERTTKPALIQHIMRLWQRAQRDGITRNFNWSSFVNLNSSALRSESSSQTNMPTQFRRLVDIRVSGDVIIEVFATVEEEQCSRNDVAFSEAKDFSPWEESFAERSETRRALKGVHRARQLRYLVAYGMLVTCAAMVIWYALS